MEKTQDFLILFVNAAMMHLDSGKGGLRLPDQWFSIASAHSLRDTQIGHETGIVSRDGWSVYAS